MHTRIAYVRQDFLHRPSRQIAAQHAMVVMEDLQVRTMSASGKGCTGAPGTAVF